MLPVPLLVCTRGGSRGPRMRKTGKMLRSKCSRPATWSGPRRKDPGQRMLISVADPGSGALLTPGSGIQDGYLKNQDPDPGSGSGMKILDHIFESLETVINS